MIAKTCTFRHLFAGPELKGLSCNLKNVISFFCRNKGPEKISIVYHLSGKPDPGKFFFGKMDAGITLRILQGNIVPWPVFLNQGIFEEKGLNLSICNNEIKIAYCLYKTFGFGVMVPFLEITAHPLFKVFCLTHVKHSPLPVLE